ncbi:MAG: hypothetical protein Q4F74_04460, partial [Synergistaceae bacterium]|nr:hypothetical protein [Synergistaceae bacterium]
MRKISTIVVLSIFAGLTITAGAFAKDKPKALVIASGNSGGTYYYIAAGQAKILSQAMKGFSVTTESTRGSPVENSSFVQDDAGTLGI